MKKEVIMLTETLKKIGEFCSLKAPQGTAHNKRKAGFTLVELMVVIIIVNLLSGVAIPKCTDLIEKSREKIDLLKFYYLRDAFDRALYEDDAYRVTEGQTCGNNPTSTNSDSLKSWLTTEKGVALFIMEFHGSTSVNFQGENNKRIHDNQNMCGLLASDGFWNSVFRDAGFGAIADIIYARARGDNFNAYPGDYYVEAFSPKKNTTWNRTYPKNPIFNSKALNNDYRMSGENQARYSMRVRWVGGKEANHSVEIFLAKDATTEVLMSRFGTCFSTNQNACNKKR